MAKVVLFNKPLWVADDDGGNETIKEIYGFYLIFDIGIKRKHIDGYVNFLCGCSTWQYLGNYYCDPLWIRRNGDICKSYEPCILAFQQEARNLLHLRWWIVESGDILDEEEIKTGFLTDPYLYEELVDCGEQIDICKLPKRPIKRVNKKPRVNGHSS